MSVVFEKEFILVCVGLFDDFDGCDFIICFKYWVEFGVRFRFIIKC